MRRLTLLLALAATIASAAPTGVIGETRIARWQDDQRAVFLLMFDDSWPSAWQVAVPALLERQMIATFYLNPGKGEYLKFKDQWEDKLWRLGMVYGNHTMTHQGAQTLADAEREVGDCTRAILKMVPGKQPRLLSWGMPGVKTWNVKTAELQALLDKDHLISRPDFKGHGAVYHWQTTAQMLALADQAIATGGMEYLVIHGVERIKPDWHYQDFWALKQSVFLPLLDGLKERRDRGDLWLTDHISQVQYERERDAATVKVVEATDARIRLELTATTDPALYDLPLTLVTRVPAAWTQAKVTQGDRTATVKADQGQVKLRAVPGGGPIELIAAP